MPPETVTADLQHRILEAGKVGDFAQLESLWLELAENPPTDQEFYHKLIRRVGSTIDAEPMCNLMLLALAELDQRGATETVFAVVNKMAPVWPESPEVRKAASRALKAKHGDLPEYSQLIGACKGLPLDKALAKFESLLRFLPGNVYSHAYWGEGIVRELNLPAGAITLDFPVEQNKVLKLDFFQKHLTYQPPTSFLARRALEPEKLLAEARENPSAVVNTILRSFGGRMKQSDLKQMLMPDVIPAEQWASWWNRARAELQADPFIDFAGKGGAHVELVLRKTARSIADDIDALFFATDSNYDKKAAAVTRLAEAFRAATATGQEPPVSKELLEKMMQGANREFDANVESSEAQHLRWLFLAEDVARLDETGEIAKQIPLTAEAVGPHEDYEFLLAFEQAEHGARALDALVSQATHEQAEKLTAVFPQAPAKLAQAIWKLLDTPEHQQLTARALRHLLDRPIENAETYVWALKQVFEGKWSHLEDDVPLSSVVREVVHQISDWHFLTQKEGTERTMVAAAKLLVSRSRSLLQARNFDPLCKAAEHMPPAEVQALRHAVQICDAFGEAFKSAADRQIVLTRTDLMEANRGRAASAAGALEDAVHYTTPRALQKAARDLEELNTVKIPQNAKEIEKARGEGDLKENAGYHGARERHVLLLQRANQLQVDLAKARVFEASKVSTETIGYGVAFEAQNLTKDRTENYTVLGQWESDPENRIYSYQAPLIRQFLGKRVGDEFTVTTPDGKPIDYRILKTTNALADGSWEAEPE